MCALTQDACLRCFWASTHIDEEWQTAMLQIEADAFDETFRPLISNGDADLAHGLGIALLRPVALTVRTGTHGMVANATLPECMRYTMILLAKSKNERHFEGEFAECQS